jgi:hypothetical protein
MKVLHEFNEEERHIAEEVLTELVVLAMQVRPALRDYISNLCDGIADALDEDAVDRSKQYALLRIQQLEPIEDDE